MVINIVLFTILFLIITNWFQLFTFLKIITGRKVIRSVIEDSWISKTIKEKTGLIISEINIFHEKAMYGMMAGIRPWPKLILSEGLYRNLNKNELEWVMLHEAGHAVLWHNLQALLFEVVLIVFGILIIWTTNMVLPLSILFSMLLSLICIQIIRWFIEYKADEYAISRVTNPRGVITAQEKFSKSNYQTPLNKEGSLLRFLLHWNITPSIRIEMAKKRL
jgi:Zn-dependent protease with chaperone function